MEDFVGDAIDQLLGDSDFVWLDGAYLDHIEDYSPGAFRDFTFASIIIIWRPL